MACTRVYVRFGLTCSVLHGTVLVDDLIFSEAVGVGKFVNYERKEVSE